MAHVDGAAPTHATTAETSISPTGHLAATRPHRPRPPADDRPGRRCPRRWCPGQHTTATTTTTAATRRRRQRRPPRRRLPRRRPCRHHRGCPTSRPDRRWFRSRDARGARCATAARDLPGRARGAMVVDPAVVGDVDDKTEAHSRRVDVLAQARNAHARQRRVRTRSIPKDGDTYLGAPGRDPGRQGQEQLRVHPARRRT